MTAADLKSKQLPENEETSIPEKKVNYLKQLWTQMIKSISDQIKTTKKTAERATPIVNKTSEQVDDLIINLCLLSKEELESFIKENDFSNEVIRNSLVQELGIGKVIDLMLEVEKGKCDKNYNLEHIELITSLLKFSNKESQIIIKQKQNRHLRPKFY